MKSAFVTGATGFVGTALCKELTKRNLPFRAGVRNAQTVNQVSVGEITETKNWPDLLSGIDVIVHLAARVHVMQESAADPLTEFRKTNCDATLKLAQAAKLAHVRRFIYLSSVKVNGEETDQTPFHASDPPAPLDPYGVSKLEAEQGLMRMHQPGVFEVVIIRPPLVYGPNVKANFQSLFNMVGKKLPLPFGLVKNRRSLVSVFNLVDLIIHCFEHPKAGGKVFLISDDHDLSLKELLQEMAKAQKVPLFLIPVPVSLMKTVATVLGKKSYADRLFGNLHLDISETKNRLNWKPKFSFSDTFQER